MKKSITWLSSITSLLLIWYLIYIIIDEPVLMPSVIDVLKAIPHIFNKEGVISLLMSLIRLIISFSCAMLFGIIFGFISAKYEAMEQFQKPYISLLRTIPVLSIIVILFILVGSSLAPYVIVFLMIFPLFYQSTIDIIKRIDPALLDVLKLNEGHIKESIKYIYFPILNEGLHVTLLQGIGLGIKVLVMSEYLMQTKHSIGKMIFQAKVMLHYDQVYLWTLLLIIMTMLIEFMTFMIKRKQLSKK